jgi:hypothetical protein
MYRTITSIFIIALLSACSANSQKLAEVQANVSSPERLDGVYEFVSESIILTQPKKSTSERTSSEWAGIWQFHNGYYTRVMMKRRRDRFFQYNSLDNLGFESSAGPYEIGGESVLLSQPLAFIPLQVDRHVRLTYRIDGDTLTLIENLQPYVEDIREGTITTVLRRLK